MAGLSVGNGLSIGNGLSGAYGLSRGSGISFPGFSPAPIVIFDFVSSQVLNAFLTYSRPSNATQIDSSGYITYSPNNLQTYSNDFASVNWTKSGGGTGTAPVVTASYAAGPTGVAGAASRVTFNLAGGSTSTDLSQLQSPSRTTITHVQYIRSLWVKSTDGSSSYTMVFTDPADVSKAITVGPTWTQIFYKALGAGVSTSRIRLRGNEGTSNTADILIAYEQLEALTYETTPRAYNETTAAAYYGPRFAYDMSTLSLRGLQMEPSRTNYLVQSFDFSNAIWVAANLTKTLSAVLGPDNITQCYELAATAGNGTVRSVGASISGAIPRTASIYLKRKTGTGNVTISNGNSSAVCALTTNWQRFSISGIGVSGTYTVVTNVVTVTATAHGLTTGDTIYAYITSGTAFSASTGGITVLDANTFTYALITADTTGNITYYPNVCRVTLATSGDVVYATAAQLEVGNGATSYLPTAGSAIVRSADTIDITGASFTAWFVSPGSFYMEYETAELVTPSNAAAIFSIFSGTTAWAYAYQNTNDTQRCDSGTSGSNLMVSATTTANTRYKMAGAIDAATNVILSGNTLQSGVPVGLPTPDTMRFNRSATGSNLGNYFLRNFSFYNSVLNTADLTRLIT